MQQPELVFQNEPQGITLSEFNERIEDTLNRNAFLQRQWVIAETSDVRENRSGHCYLELIEKDARGGTVAKLGAVIWAGNYRALSAQFEYKTGMRFATGMKVLVNITANFHAQYGLKAVINDINPEYTLGDMARQRIEILNRLKSEGIIDMNKELEWAPVPQRIAIISAEGAAGYGDFMNQLQNNVYGLQFYTCLFSAVMQGNQTVPSVLNALDRINDNIDLFDCVVIIRGGGATSELNSFDNYDLAASVAQFPIPVIVGIGHDRDETVLDYVAAKRVKTPTAAAEWLIQQGSNALAYVDELQDVIVSAVRDNLAQAREQMAYYTSMIPAVARRIVDTSRVRLNHYATTIPMAATGRIAAQRTGLDHAVQRIQSAVATAMQREQQRLQTLTDKATLLSPVNTLKRGYSLVRVGDKCVTDASQLREGISINVQFANGTADATVNHVENQ